MYCFNRFAVAVEIIDRPGCAALNCRVATSLQCGTGGYQFQGGMGAGDNDALA